MSAPKIPWLSQNDSIYLWAGLVCGNCANFPKRLQANGVGDCHARNGGVNRVSPETQACMAYYPKNMHGAA